MVATVGIGIRTNQRYVIAKLGQETVIVAESETFEGKQLQPSKVIDSKQVAECICMHWPQEDKKALKKQ